jgi:hypothetical protein
MKNLSLLVDEEFGEVPVDAFAKKTFGARLEVSENSVTRRRAKGTVSILGSGE